VSRLFRHSAVYIRSDRGIRDLRFEGQGIGLPEYQITAVVWLRGIMQDEYGVKPADIHWRQGGIEEPGRTERTPLKPIPGLDLKPIPPDKTLSGMLEAGELDAMFSARAPSCFVRRAPNIARLFPDYREVEKAYYKKTGIFPPMHLMGVKRELAAQQPWLPASLFKAFAQAKGAGAARGEGDQRAARHAALAGGRSRGIGAPDGRGFLALRRQGETPRTSTR
jgi:4,5-dihydroxyphthalate decarboxylase